MKHLDVKFRQRKDISTVSYVVVTVKFVFIGVFIYSFLAHKYSDL